MIINITPTVKEISALNFAGNIVPHTWYQNNLLKLDSGRVNVMAINILSDIVYWYRQKVEEDEETGHIKAVTKKFSGDKLQKTYQSWADQFGVSKRTVQEACYFLYRKGIIDIDIQDKIKTKTGMILNNVTYFEPIPEVIKSLNSPEDVEKFTIGWYARTNDRRKTKCDMDHILVLEGSHQNVIGVTPECDTCTKITSENTHENTPNTWSSRSSDNKSEDLEITSSEKNTRNVSGKILTKAQIKKDLVNSKLQSPEFIKFFEEIRSKYSLYAGNRFLNHFAKHKSQFYKTLAYRVANEDFTQEEVEKVFGLMTQNTDFSLIEFFGNLKNQKYDEKKILVDFIWVMNDGKISAPTAERKGAKELCGWITENKTTLKEIEDCLLWFPDSGRGYKNSLLSVKSALSEFDRVKRDIGNGRYVGSALNGGYKTKDEITVETLSQRDYDSTAKDVLAAGKAQKEYLQSLIEGTK